MYNRDLWDFYEHRQGLRQMVYNDNGKIWYLEERKNIPSGYIFLMFCGAVLFAHIFRVIQ